MKAGIKTEKENETKENEKVKGKQYLRGFWQKFHEKSLKLKSLYMYTCTHKHLKSSRFGRCGGLYNMYALLYE